MEELANSPEPSGPSRRSALSKLFRPLREAGKPRGVNAWYKATFLASLACIFLYTAFGLIFVRLHALRLADEMRLLARFGMTALIRPDDAHLANPLHQLASGLFFGMTLGTLCAMVCMILSLPAWLWGGFKRFDLAAFAGAVLLCTYFTFSMEMPWVSICFGLLCPALFMAVWLYFIRTKSLHHPKYLRWAVFCAVIIAPLIIIVATIPSFQSIRDYMLTSRLTEPLSDVYYEHTLLAADVIKPVWARSQNVVAVSSEIKDLGYIPHGTLWIQSSNPCSIDGASFAVSRAELGCRSVEIPADGMSANEGNRILEVFGKALDSNRFMRKGIGFFFFSGPLIVISVLLLSWLALAMEMVHIHSRKASFIMVCLYMSMFVPLFHSAYLDIKIRSHPDLIQQFASSAIERERYCAIAIYPGALAKDDLIRMMNDPSPRVRLNALVEAGNRRDSTLMGPISGRLGDTKMNVRTKACWALGKIPSVEVADILDKVVRDDPSWYVRDYAYASIGRIRPEAKTVHLHE